MHKSSVNFLMVNQPLNNRGDESAHKALVKMILQSIPTAKIQVVFVGQNQDAISAFDVHDSRVSYVNIRPKKNFARFFLLGLRFNCVFLAKVHPTIRHILSVYKKADVVLNAPGGVCMGGFQNWGHMVLLLFAKYLKKTIVYYGRSIGPFPTRTMNNRIFRETSIDMLHYISFLSLRDKKSMDLADSLNIKYEPTVDSAFLEKPEVGIPQDLLNVIGSKPYVVFVPNLLIWHYAYKNKASLGDVLVFYNKILDYIIAKYPEHNVVMLPQTFYFDDKNKGDINFFRDLKQYTQCKKLIIAPDTYNSDVQQTVISKADCMIGARYHSVVFAINQAIPFVALSYEHKISGLLETLNKTDSMVDITTAFDSEEKMQYVIERFKSVLDFAHKDIDTQMKAKNIARACFNKFLNFCSENDFL